jgi:ribonucleoside-diphosphate reductase alpha chain
LTNQKPPPRKKRRNIMTDFTNEFSKEVWATTYKDYTDTTVDDTFKRVAKAISKAEATPESQAMWESRFYDLLSDFKGVAGGRITANAGTEWAGTTFANCYVGPLPSENLDSIDGIYKVLRDQAQTLKSEGGWGMDFSWIRPRGSFIQGVGVESPGSVKFMELFDRSSEIVTSGSGGKSKNAKSKGKIRKGAMMSTLSVTHPDIVEFITAKQTAGKLSKFNMSVNCTDEFMKKVISVTAGNTEDDNWDLIFPDTTDVHYKKEWDGSITKWKAKGYPIVIHQTVKVSWLWNLIMESTYNRNEPGVLFLDRANHYNPLNYLETILSTNPCGEQTLAAGGVCDLGTLNLTQFLNKDKTGFDLQKLEKYVEYLVRFLDNVNELSDAPLPEYIDSMKHKRRIGAGVMGWGSALFMLNIRFGSAEAEALRESVMSTYTRAAYKASIDLAIEKGMFKYCDPVKHAESVFVKSLGLGDEYMAKLRTTGIRNSSLISQQPNGNGSIFANMVTGGIEPAFMPEYVRTSIVPTVPDHIKDVTPNFHLGEFHETALFKLTKEGDDDILRGVDEFGVVFKIDRNRGLVKETLCEDYGIRELKAAGKYDDAKQSGVIVTTTELSVSDHVNDLRGFARWADSACSKTCNIPNDYAFDDFKKLYLEVYNTGVIKGFTTYRSGTMASVLSAATETKEAEEEIILESIILPDALPAMLKTLRAEGRKWYLTLLLNELKTKPVALFAHTNHHEKNITADDAVERLIELARAKSVPEQYVLQTIKKMSGDTNTTKICRIISLCLRHGVLIRNIVGQLEKVECVVGTFVFHIRKYLGTFIQDGEKVKDETCSACGSANVVYQEGCKVCADCGSSKCG